MHGLGTIVNVAAIVVGGLAGLLGGRRIPERLQKTLMSAMGVSVLFVGVSGALSQMLRAGGGALTVQGTMMMILSLAIGAVAGELLDLEDRMAQGQDEKRVGRRLHRRLRHRVPHGLHRRDGHRRLHPGRHPRRPRDAVRQGRARSCDHHGHDGLDGQGLHLLRHPGRHPVFTDAALSNLSLVGSVLVFCVGLNLVWGKKIRVANLLPSLIVSVVWAFL